MDAAKRHGYRPNPSARRLATGKSGMIGYVLPTGAAVDIDPHFVEFLSGLGDYARAHELDLVLSPADADDEEATYRRIVANRQVDAVYLSSPRPADKRLALVNTLGIPFIVHGRSEGFDFDYPYLDIDNEGAFHEASRLLIQLGHKRLALINGNDRETFAIHRERGMRRALAANGLTLGERHIRSVAMTEENGYRAARRLLEEGEPPTAIVCSSLIMALGVVRAVRDLGLTFRATCHWSPMTTSSPGCGRRISRCRCRRHALRSALPAPASQNGSRHAFRGWRRVRAARSGRSIWWCGDRWQGRRCKSGTGCCRASFVGQRSASAAPDLGR